MRPVLGFFFRTGRAWNEAAAEAPAEACAGGVEAAMLNRLAGGVAGAGASGDGGTTNSVWQDGQLIWRPEYSVVAWIFCRQLGQENFNSLINGLC